MRRLQICRRATKWRLPPPIPLEFADGSVPHLQSIARSDLPARATLSIVHPLPKYNSRVEPRVQFRVHTPDNTNCEWADRRWCLPQRCPHPLPKIFAGTAKGFSCWRHNAAAESPFAWRAKMGDTLQCGAERGGVRRESSHPPFRQSVPRSFYSTPSRRRYPDRARAPPTICDRLR
jgi:hypothetical protein